MDILLCRLVDVFLDDRQLPAMFNLLYVVAILSTWFVIYEYLDKILHGLLKLARPTELDLKSHLNVTSFPCVLFALNFKVDISSSNYHKTYFLGILGN